MRFWLLDRICDFEPDAELTAVKSVALSEQYLGDHFPQFPVLPGVFMLEAATQAGAWLIRLSEDFKHSIIVLNEAKAVKFANFVRPGNTLKINVRQSKCDDRYNQMKFTGEVDGQTYVSGRLVLERYNLADDDSELSRLDADLIRHQRMVASVFAKNWLAGAMAGTSSANGG